ncbi:hypothetical protein [Hyphomicrobium sulfonivorans]|uniref:hypothetical protein n=1 Tax=Hyphomicrobium sulfonivorans TaxID=121290 RepID=UPI0018E1A9F8|nr:hypothetical protein [Hyphomicrobium sulfonivorans]MBI1650110.1 hypothetical protein [Hyphomicrobium sulfonivorans]
MDNRLDPASKAHWALGAAVLKRFGTVSTFFGVGTAGTAGPGGLPGEGGAGGVPSDFGQGGNGGGGAGGAGTLVTGSGGANSNTGFIQGGKAMEALRVQPLSLQAPVAAAPVTASSFPETTAHSSTRKPERWLEATAAMPLPIPVSSGGSGGYEITE